MFFQLTAHGCPSLFVLVPPKAVFNANTHLLLKPLSVTGLLSALRSAWRIVTQCQKCYTGLLFVITKSNSFPHSNADVCDTDRQHRLLYCMQTGPLGNQTSLQIVQVSDRCLVHSILHHTLDLVVHRAEVWAVWQPQVWVMNCGVERRRKSTVSLSCWKIK